MDNSSQRSSFEQPLSHDPIEEEIKNEIKEKEREHLRQKLLNFADQDVGTEVSGMADLRQIPVYE